jgi:VanZ family protein
MWAALILVCSSVPLPASAPGTEIPGLDKLVHFSLYAVLGWLLARARGARGGRALAWILAIAAFGAMDEWHQRFIIGRSPDLADWLADGAGGLVGFMAAAAPQRREHVT